METRARALATVVAMAAERATSGSCCRTSFSRRTSTHRTGTTFVLVEHDLLFRQYRFHTQKLVLHRASMRRFADRLRERGFDVEHVETDGRTTSRAALARVVRAAARRPA